MKSTRKSLRETVAANTKSMRMYAAFSTKPVDESIFDLADAIVNKPKRVSKPRDPDKTRNGNEHAVQSDIMKALRHHPKVAWIARFNSSNLTVSDDYGKVRYVRSNTQRGMSDTMGMLHGGRLFAIEVKRPGVKITEAHAHQREFLELIKAGGGIAGFAWSVEDAVKLIEG